jgi:hypothetical protein
VEEDGADGGSPGEALVEEDGADGGSPGEALVEEDGADGGSSGEDGAGEESRLAWLPAIRTTPATATRTMAGVIMIAGDDCAYGLG